MAKLLQIDFTYQGPFGDEMAAVLKELAHSIAAEPGFLWKIWTESEQEQRAGGIYLFEDEQSARAYLKKHTERLKSFGVDKVNAKIFDVSKELTEITKGPVK